MTDTSAAAAVEASAAQARPAALKPIALAMCALNGLAFFVLDPSLDSFPVALSVTIALVAVSLAVIWFFWRGRNWARWAVLFGSVLNLVSLAVPMDMNTGETVLSAAYVALSLWLLYWLNTARVKEYFRRTPSGWTLGRTGVVIVATLAACVILFFVAVVVLMLLTPTDRPASRPNDPGEFHDRVTAAWRARGGATAR